MKHKKKTFDCIVIGAGHAGIEAALAASRMKSATLLVNLSFDSIGQMSCNPAIGGVGKGQLVKEIDVLGGEMGVAADNTAIQFRQLNVSKGRAVRSSRCQSDRVQYKKYMQEVVGKQKLLTVLEGQVTEILTKDKKVAGIKTASNEQFDAKTIVVAAGTFLRGRIHVGKDIVSGGRIGDPASNLLAGSIEKLGMPIITFKTGTPPRLDGRTIDYSQLQRQDSDDIPVPFSFRTKRILKSRKLLPCHITHTNQETHSIIKKNFHLSPMYSGQMDATGVRYCPSIEDKLKKFSTKGTHHVFLEPDGLKTNVVYPNGISTGLPADVQEQFVHSIKGLENAKILQPGYSIEHGMIPPTELRPHLETKKIGGLFLAGQINGSTGYEEAAAQGIIAGINAALKVKGKEPFILGRDESYIGVLIDDLVTKGTQEPYRMFTSRVEYRLLLREDNADYRMAKYGHEFGLISKLEINRVKAKYKVIEEQIKHLKSARIRPGKAINNMLSACASSLLKQPTYLNNILKRPGVSYNDIQAFNVKHKKMTVDIISQIEYEIKYEGFIKRQRKEVDRFKHIENIKIPSGFDFSKVHGLSHEIKEKLIRFSPITLGQANRISGITPAAISILMVFLRKKPHSK